MTTLSKPQQTTLSAHFSGDPWQAARVAWLDAKQARSGSEHTRRAYDKALTDFLDFLAQLGRHPAQAGGVEIESYRAHLATDHAPATVGQRLAAISSFYSYCQHKYTLRHDGMEITLTSFNPVDRASRPRVDPFAGAQKVRPDEIPLLLAEPDQDTIQGKRDYSMLLTFVFTGRRLAELARLLFGDLEITPGGVSYTYTGKGGKTNTRQLPPPVWDSLQLYWQAAKRLPMVDNSPLWVAISEAGINLPNVDTNDVRPLSVSSIRRLVNRYSQAALGRCESPHSLRHAAAMLREQAGDDPRAIQKLLDHSSLEMTDRYMSSMRTDKDTSWRAVAKMLGV